MKESQVNQSINQIIHSSLGLPKWLGRHRSRVFGLRSFGPGNLYLHLILNILNSGNFMQSKVREFRNHLDLEEPGSARYRGCHAILTHC